MGLISAAEFERALGQLDRQRLTAFVAALYDARGFESTVEDGLVRVERSGTVEVLAVVSAGRSLSTFVPDFAVPSTSAPEIPSRADGVVVTDSGISDSEIAHTEATQYVTPRELHRVLLYGIDRDDAVALSRRYLSQPLRSPDSTGSSLRRIGVVAVALVLVASALAVGLPMESGSESEATSTSEQTGVSPGQGNGTILTASTGAGPESTQYPDGVTGDGIVDAEALAAGHQAGLEYRSYRVFVRGQGHIAPIDVSPAERGASPEWGTFSQRVTVSGPGRYRSTLAGIPADGETQSQTRVRADYADGIDTYRRNSTGNLTYEKFSRPPGVVRLGMAITIERYLTTTESSVEVLSSGRVRVIATGTPLLIEEPTREYRAVATVDQSGVVRSLRVTYYDPSLMSTASQPLYFYMSLDQFGEQRVESPDWYDDAIVATKEW
jgi:hypothetical protein